MAETRQSIHGQWTSRFAFILAATGAAVGLGNIWKFPYIAGENGGGAFVLVYLLCILLVGGPLLMSEILLGRRGRQNPINSIRSIAKDENRSKYWAVIGLMGIVASFLILSYYSVIAGWALDYVFKSGMGQFAGQNAQSIDATFDKFIANPWALIFWHTIIIGFTVFVVARGVQKGIESAVRFMFPLMVVLLLILVGYAMDTGYFFKGVEFLFHPDFAKLTPEGFLTALGHAFFTLSLATGSIMMYGAYVPKQSSIATAAIWIIIADTAVALISGLAIFPMVFANGLVPSAGPGLIFQTLPIAFGQMGFGRIFGTLFFIMLVIAAFTSAISLLEPTVAWLMERLKIMRLQATIFAGIGIWLLGIGTVLSFNAMPGHFLFGMNFFDFLDYLTANILLPLGGLLMIIFTAWVLPRHTTEDELNMKGKVYYRLWLYGSRFITPFAILVVFLGSLGLFNGF